VNLHKEAIDAGGNAGSRQVRNVLRLPTRTLPLTAGELQTVSQVKDHQTFQTSHDGKAAEVDHKIVVSERHSTLRQQQPIVSRFAHFLDDVLHLPWRQERSEEHTSELQSRSDLVCRLLL